jgi:hypothetical protein
MAVTVSVAHLGDAELAREVQVAIEHVLANYPGEWRCLWSARRQMTAGN